MGKRHDPEPTWRTWACVAWLIACGTASAAMPPTLAFCLVAANVLGGLGLAAAMLGHVPTDADDDLAETRSVCGWDGYAENA